MNMPWFKFWAARWMSSATVNSMTAGEERVVVRILCGLSIYGKVPRDPWQLSRLLSTNYRTTSKWLLKYSHFTADCQSIDSELLVGCQSTDSYFTVPKFFELQELKGKSTPDFAGDKKRRDERRRDEDKTTPEQQVASGSKPVLEFESSPVPQVPEAPVQLQQES